MPRMLVILIGLIILLIAGMFYLASIDVEQEPKLVEKPVIGETLEQ